jgi:hypothetical protein
MDQPDTTKGAFPETFDHIYFMDTAWAKRLEQCRNC